jgi:polyhydroxyalkanoate synthesis regulator phasin
MAEGYSRAKYIDDLVSSGEFNYEEAKKYADEYERGAPTKVEKPESAAISEPSPADVQAGLKEMKTEREKQEGMTFAEKAALGVGGVAAGGAATYLLTRRPSIKDRMIGDTARIEPQMDVNQQGPKEPTFAPEKPTALTKAASVAEQFQSEYGIPLSEVEKHYQVPIKDMQEARLLGGAYKANMAPAAPAGVIPSTTNMTTSAPIGVAPPAAMLQPAISAAPAPVAPVPTPAAPVVEVPVVAATEAAVPPSIASTEAPAKKTGRPAAATLEPTTFRADLGPGDNWLYNTAGPDRRRAILAEFNEGKPVKDYKTAQEIYKKYQEKYPKDMFGPVIPIEEAKGRGIKPPEPYGKLGKVAKVGGVAGLALTAAEMANAAQKAQQGNQAPLRETIFNLLGMVPGLGTAFSAGTFSGGLNENEGAELARRRSMPPEITKR